MLNELMVDYETVNVLDDYYNPNLLFVIKDFSDWPTIPQLYVNGELLGGHDIVNAMHEAANSRLSSARRSIIIFRSCDENE